MESNTKNEGNYNISIDVDHYLKLRRQFHTIPEIGLKEYKTKQLIVENLNKIEHFKEYSKVTEVGDTGMFVDIYGLKDPSENDKTKEKYLISLRADIDGLPFKEDSEFDYKSQHEGMIHGCGHDGHIIILIATIEYYLKNLNKIPKIFGVRFLFQPAEEGLRGAIEMIRGGCLEGVNEIYGLHNIPIFAVGEVGAISGTIMARVDLFEISIKGKGGHSSVPHKCCSPITTGVQIVSAINQISSQEIDSNDRNVIALGSFQAGSTYNVIPETGIIKGTIRSLNNDVGSNIINRIKEVSETIAKLNRSSASVTSEGATCTINHEEPSKLVQQIAKKYFKLEIHNLPLMASEDFSDYLNKTPGCFFMLGTGDENHKVYVHTPTYDYNDKSTPFGVEMFIRIIEEKSGVILI